MLHKFYQVTIKVRKCRRKVSEIIESAIFLQASTISTVFERCPSKVKSMKGNKNGRKWSENRAFSNNSATYRASCLPIMFVCNLIVVRLHYSQGCLELKKEEQSRATNWGLIGAID
ncbi:hypothetical protein M9H77_29632 [Catharanthus roseus]|uniref:Uncharacterized protein n=1 Tax=Catharanthus roseus TaxID=4058 RepID=A0ACB9ZWU4_CATRO|nr:hypothetical protein M9H77_29632 [Catharanthus roseus]